MYRELKCSHHLLNLIYKNQLLDWISIQMMCITVVILPFQKDNSKKKSYYALYDPHMVPYIEESYDLRNINADVIRA